MEVVERLLQDDRIDISNVYDIVPIQVMNMIDKEQVIVDVLQVKYKIKISELLNIIIRLIQRRCII